MNRGRIKWENMLNIEIPVYNEKTHKIKKIVITLKELWKSYTKHHLMKKQQIKELTSDLKLEDEEARKRWLANKPPE